MIDLASLSLKIDSSQVDEGVDRLDQLTTAGTRAEKVVDHLGDSAAQTGRQVKSASAAAAEMAREAQRSAAGATAMGGASRLASHHVQNLAFQAQDLFIGLASGQRPMTVFLQQGSQVAGIMSQAGIGVGGLAKQVGSMVAGFARAHPILVAIGAAAGVAAGGLQLFQAEVEKSGELEEYAAGLGLTKKEMEELEDVGVTAGDTFRGLYRTLDEYLGLTEVFATIKKYAVDAFMAILQAGKVAAAGIYAGFVGGARAIGAVWKNLPGIIGEGVIGAANLTIQTIESMVNRAIVLLNAPIVAVNALLKRVGMPGLGQIGQVNIGRLSNPFAGSTRQAGADVRGAFANAYGEATSGLDQFGADVRRNTLEAAQDRLRGQAEGIIGDRTDKAGRASRDRAKATDEEAKALERAIEASTRYAETLEGETARIGKTAIEIKRMEVAANAALAPTTELRDRIIEAGQAWEAATRAAADADFDENIIRPLITESKLLGLVGEQRELAALALEEEAFKAEMAAKGISDVNDAWERYSAWKERIIRQESALDREIDAFEARYGRVRDFLEEINKSPAQIAAAFDDIKIAGLDALNDGLVDAITGARSLGSVFHDVAAQILADLLRLQIQQAILGPLASVLGLSVPGSAFAGGASSLGGSLAAGAAGGGGGGLLSSIATAVGSLFGGGRAEGGPISPGKFYAVNERSTAPGLFIPLSPGTIERPRSPGANDNSAAPVSISISNDFRGADPAAVAAIQGRIDRLQRDLPGQIVNTMQDARARFVWRDR